MKINKNIGNSKISEEQIERLYRFTREHFVEHYDLQTELVDHLALMVEDIWQTEPELPFESALQKAFKSFGVFGFSDIVQERSSALGKRYNKIIWQEFKTFFNPPKILLTAALTGFLYLALYWGLLLNKPVLMMLVLITVIVFGWTLRNISKNVKKLNASDKKLMFAEIIAQNGNSTAFSGLPLQFVIHLDLFIDTSSHLLLFGISFLYVAFGLITYVMVVIVPKKAQEYLKEVYPELSVG